MKVTTLIEQKKTLFWNFYKDDLGVYDEDRCKIWRDPLGWLRVPTLERIQKKKMI